MKKRILSILLVTVMVITMFPFVPITAKAETTVTETTETVSAAWDGTVEQPTKKRLINGVYYYEIATPEELAYVAQTGGDWANYNYILVNDIVLNDVELTYDEEGNITADTSNLNVWTMLCLYGAFDGDGYTVKGVYVDSSADAAFMCSNNTIKNLNLTNAYIRGCDAVAGIDATNVMNCTFDGAIVNETIEELSSGARGCTGAFSCFAAQVVENCINYGDIFGNSCVGGIIGKTYWGPETKINNCINYGKIVGKSDYVGGISGIGGNVSQCSNYGKVSGNNYVGGILGYSNDNDITSTSNSGNINGVNYVGGTVGYYNGDDNCTEFLNSGKVVGENYVGGLIGYYTDATIDEGYSTGEVFGETNVGALIGYSDSVWGRGTASNLYYLKDDTVNTNLFGFGNCEEDIDGITIPCDKSAFCLSEEGKLSVEHTYKWQYNTEKDCLELGSKYYGCTNCNDISKLSVAGHISSDWIVDKETTATTDGERHTECTVCGEILETDTLTKNNYELSFEKATQAINRATMFASEESYTWERNTYVIERPYTQDDLYEGDGIIAILSSINEENYADCIYEAIGGIDNKSAKVTNGVKPGEMDDWAYLLKSMCIEESDIIDVVASKDNSKIIYTLSLKESINSCENSTALNHATNGYLDEFRVRDNVCQYVDKLLPGYSVYVDSYEFKYSNITLKVTVEDCYVKSVDISYKVDAKMNLSVGFENVLTGFTILVSEKYIDFKYQRSVPHCYEDLKIVVEPSCTKTGEGTQTCAYCGKIEKIEIPKSEHYYENGVCVWCGYTDDAPVYFNGWINENGYWAYYENGVKVTNKWVEDSVGWCYVGADGYCVTNCWKADSKGWCYLDANGRMATNKWIKDSVGWCYVGADGYCVTNKWVKDSVGWCYLDANGRMATNKWIKDSVGWCYVGANGYCVTNKWVKDSTGWCYLDSNGRMVYNKWVKDSVGWCYVGSSGYMVTNQWVKDGNYWYYLDGNGYMVTGTKVINGKTYKFASNGVWLG